MIVRVNYVLHNITLLWIIGFIRTKLVDFVSVEKGRTFRIPFDAQVGRIGMRIFPNAVFLVFLQPALEEAVFSYAGLVIANSLSSIVIADTSERLDKNDFSRAATVRHLRIFLSRKQRSSIPMAFLRFTVC